jgi:hypothetical protein
MLLHNQLLYFIIIALSHGVGYMRALLYCFPSIFIVFLGEIKGSRKTIVILLLIRVELKLYKGLLSH